MSAEKERTLQEIAALCRRHNVLLSELQPYIHAQRKPPSLLVQRLFAYLAALAFLASIAIFFSLKGEEWGAYFRTVFLVGSGLSFFAAALSIVGQEKLEVLFNPLLLVSGVLLPVGLGFFLADFFEGGNPDLAACIICAVVGGQFTFAYFYTSRRNGPLFGALIFFYMLMLALYNLVVPRILDADNSLFFIFYGLSGFASATILSRTKHGALSSFFQICGMIIALVAVYIFADDNNIAFVTPLAGIAAVYGALRIQNRGVLAVSVLALVSYVGMVTKEYFPDALAWPLILFLIGLGLALAVFFDFNKMKAHFLKSPPIK